MGATDVDGAARVAAVGADGDGVVPVEAGAGEGERHGGDTGHDAQVLGPEPFPEQTHDAEESGVPGGQDDDRSVRRR